MHQRIYKHRQIQDSRDVKIDKGEFQFIRKNNFTKVFKAENIHLRLVQSTTLSITCQIGADLCTNLVILSPHLITLHDPQLIKVEDCYNTYHYPRQLVNKKSRADHLIQMCHKLNNKVYVDKTATEITEEGCLKYDVVIFCDVWDLGRVICIDKFIRSQKQSKTVVLYGAQMGFFGLAINDFGEQWEMYHSGQDFPKVNITKITSAQRGKVTTATPHNYQTGDFVTIHYVEGMKYVNSDARPVTVVDQTNFLIQDTRNFGQYIKGGVSQKVDLVQKLKFPSFEQQLSRRHSELMLIAKAIICFYQNNSRLPGLFDEANEEETMQNLKVLSQKSGMKYDENYARKVIKTCDYSFYPLINMFASILSLQVVKCTGKYKPIKTPFFVDWYNIINFETKKKLPDQMINIIDTSTLQKLASLQIGIVDDGSQSMQLLNLLYSCSIGEKNRVILCGLQSINETNEPDGLLLKAKLKYQVSNQLFKNKKTQTMPCSLSFSHDLILSDMWKKIKLLINTSSKLNQYVYNNVIWNQIDIVDSSISDLEAILKMCASGKSQLKQRQQNALTSSIIGSNSGQSLKLIDYRACVQLSLEQFRLIFIEIFEDVRCFFNVGGSYIDRVKMLEKRRNIFLFIICCLEDGSHMQPENIVKIAKYIFEQLFCGKLAIDQKDPLVMDYLKSLYYMISWFFTKKQPKVEQVNNQFILHLSKPYEDGSLSQKQKFDIAFTKLAMGNQLTIPYLSLNDLFKKEHTVKLIWNGSQLHAKINSLDEEINSKKFYKYYFRKLRPCPFISQIINSLIPITVLQNCYGNLKNCEIDMIQGKIQMVNCPPPIPLKHQKNTRLVPENANEWTILIVQGPKKITQIIERFNYVQNIVVTKIRCQNETLYDKEKKNLYMDFTIESIPAIIEKQKKDAYELHVQAVDREGNKCEVSRVKYTVC